MGRKTVITMPSDILRKKSEEVTKITQEIKNIFQDMEDTLQAEEGVGIAAVQIGILKRMILCKHQGKTYKMINPVILKRMGRYIEEEGCLSVKEKEYEYEIGKVERSLVVEVEYQDEEGIKQHKIVDGYLARIIQHEVDHLDGIVYTDKVEGELIKFSNKEEKKAWKEEKEKQKKARVLLGMSGGVDSSVSAILLQEMGYEVIGITMKMWNTEKEGIPFTAAEDAQKVCETLQIEHHILDCQKEFEEHVMKPFCQCYEKAETPNPCVECNTYLKFGTFYEKAKELECEYIATGHYVKTEYSEKYKQWVLKKANAIAKDQSYFLYGIQKEVLSKMVFPLADIENKEMVREIAKNHGLLVAEKPDSQEVCFIPNNDYVSFVQKNSKNSSIPGKIILKDGTIIGNHKGLIYYTVGQRKGLGISYLEPLYVIALNKEKNEVTVGTEAELYQTELYATQTHFLIPIDQEKPISIKAKIRYRAKEANAMLYILTKDSAKVIFEEKQRAITPGQSVVFYQDDVVIGGGKISK